MSSLYRKAIAPTRASYNMYRRYNEEKDEEQDLQIENKRHALDRLFDVLNVGQYVSAGAVRGAVRDDMSIIGGIIDGLRAGNPLGKGYEKGEHSYNQVLADIGWDKEDNPDGKWYNPFSWSPNNVAHNVVGFVGDIMLDPMTYVSGGTSALVKGTGKPGAKATHKVVNEMTQEVAEGIIIKQAAKRNLTKSMDDITKEASKFVKQYNKLAGVREGAKDVTLSLANAPLGEKIFGEAAEKSKTLIKGEDLQKLSDEIGIGKAYSAIRDKVYGGKLGKMFSSSHTLYQLSKTDPGAVYDRLKQLELARGITGDVQSAIKAVREHSKEFADLTPDETRELIEVMEDSSRWATFRKYMRFSDTETGKVLKKELEEVKLRTQKELDDLLETKSIVESMKNTTDSDLFDANKVYKDIHKEYREKLANLKIDKLSNEEYWNKAIQAIDDEIAKINIEEETFIKSGGRPSAENVVKSYDDYLLEKSEYIKAKNNHSLADGQTYNKAKVVEDLSNYFYGRPDYISIYTWDSDIETVVNMLKRGEPDENIINYMQKRSDFFTGRADNIHKHIARELGYGKDSLGKNSKYKTWDEYYSKRMNGKDGLIAKSYEGTLTSYEKHTFAELKQAYIKRSDMLREFRHMDSRELDLFIKEKELAKAMDLRDIEDMFYKERWSNKTSDEMRRDRFTAEDRAINENIVRSVESKQNQIVEGSNVRFIDTRKSKSKSGISSEKPSLSIDAKTGKVIDNVENYDSFSYGTIESISRNSENPKITIKTPDGKLVDIDISQIYSDNTKSFYKPSDVGSSAKNYQTGEFKDKVVRQFNQITKEHEFEIRNWVMNKVFENVDDFNPDNMTKARQQMIDAIYVESRELLKGFFDMDFDDLSLTQQELLIDMSIQKYNKKFNSKEGVMNIDKVKTQNALKARKAKQRTDHLIKTMKEGATVTIANAKGEDLSGVVQKFYTVSDKPVADIVKYSDGKLLKGVSFEDIVSVRNDLKILEPDEIIKMSNLTDEFVERKLKLVDELNFLKDKSNNVSADYKQKLATLRDDYAYRVEDIKKNIANLERESQTLQTALEVGELTNIENLTNKVKRFEDILASDDAYETYMRTQMTPKEFNKIIDDASPVERVVEIISHPDKPISEKVDRLAKRLRQDLIDMGISEVEIGKLGQEQFDTMMYKYLPHILTEDGAKLFANQEAIKKRFPQFGDDLGYGRKFNPHAKARTLKIIPDGAGGWIENPNILEANKFFKDNFNDILKGKNVFSEDIAEIYTMRALKNTELIYDSKYMDEMLDMVGDNYDFTKVGKEGYSSVMNFGKTREKVAQISKINTSLDISDAVTQYLSNKDIIDAINETTTLRMSAMTLSDDVDMGKLRKSIFNEELSNIIQNFIDENFTDEIRKGLREQHGQSFLKNSQMEKYLDDLSMPLLEINKEQFDGMRNGITSVQARLENNVKRSLTSYHRNVIQKSHHRHLLDSLTNIDSMGIDELKDVINKYKNYADEFDIERLNRMEKKLLQHAELGELQIKEVNNAIVEKSNQARKLQIQKDNNNFLNLYDKFTHLIKLNQTTILPSFHARNQYSNIFQNWLEIGGDAVSIDFQTQAAKVLKHDGATDGILKIVNSDGTLSAMGWDEIYNTAKQYGVIDEGFFAQEIGATAGSSGMLNKIPGKFDPTDTNNFIPYKKGEKIGSFVENKDRLVHFASQLSRGMSIEDAAESVNKFLFDYGDLSAFEMSTMKRIIPYYTWLRKNAALQLDMILERPEKYRMIAKISAGIENMNDEDDKIDKAFVNDFAKDWIQTPFNVTNPEGREEPVLWNPNLPYMDINRIPDITQPIESLKELFTQTNPLIKTPIEQIINRNVFFDSPIVKDGDSQILSRIDHILSQHGQYPVLRGSLRKEGADKALHRLNSLSGVKLLSYDYDKYKEMKIRELLAKQKRK